MTEGTCSIARLDRTQPPPGYTLTPSCGVWVADEGGALIREDESFDGEASAIAAAWTHYEREHDPPGLETWEDPEYGWWFFGLGSDFEWYADLQAKTGARQNPGAERKDARSAAWAWYWRRAVVAVALERFCGPAKAADWPWPACLAWPDEQVAAVERWLAEGGELPEVLRA